jgi:hypothetical protein
MVVKVREDRVADTAERVEARMLETGSEENDDS